MDGIVVSVAFIVLEADPAVEVRRICSDFELLAAAGTVQRGLATKHMSFDFFGLSKPL